MESKRIQFMVMREGERVHVPFDVDLNKLSDVARAMARSVRMLGSKNLADCLIVVRWEHHPEEKPFVFCWEWDIKEENESPEEYFERHASAFEKGNYSFLPTEPNLEDVLSFQEAAEIWGIDDSTLRKAVVSKKFYPEEIRKTSRNYIIRRSAMERLYGKLSESVKEDR